jgi:hypothetical protein
LRLTLSPSSPSKNCSRFASSASTAGVIEIPKAEVQVTDVQEALSIATTIETHELSNPMSRLLNPYDQKIILQEPLPVASGQIRPMNVEKQIRKWDKVRQVE